MIASYKMVNSSLIDHLLELDYEDLAEELQVVDKKTEYEYESVSIGKSWDGLHFLLTGKSVAILMKENQLSEAVVGVHLFGEDDNIDFISYSRSEELKEIVKALEGVKKEELQKKFSPELFSKNKIYPDIWLTGDPEDHFNFIYEGGYKPLLAFYQSALKQGKSILVSIR